MKALKMKRWNRSMIAAMGCLTLAVGGLGAITALAQEAKEPPPARKRPVELKAEFNWEKLNAQALEEYAQPIRPGSPGKSPFWGGGRELFKYAPAFDFQPVKGAKYYRFTITQWDKGGTNRIGDKAWSFEAAEPWAPLTPVWAVLPVSKSKEDVARLRLTVEGLDAKGGQAIGASKCGIVDKEVGWRLASGYVGEQYRDFRKGQPFVGPFNKTKLSLRENALRNIREVLKTSPIWTFYREYRLPVEGERGPESAKYASLGDGNWLIANGWIVARGTAFLARETVNRDEAALGLKTARNAADTIINISFPPDWKSAFSPNTLLALPNWKKYWIGEMTFEEWHKSVCDAVSTNRMEWEARSNDPGQMYLDMYDVTRETKYLDAAKRLAETYRNLQLASGAWYDGINPKTGVPSDKDAFHPPALIILFLDRLAGQYGILDYKETAERAFRWLLENRITSFHFPSKFWDTSVNKAKTQYQNQGSLAAAHVAICLFNRADQNPQYIAMGEEIVRFIEDQFVWWEDGKGYVSEQYSFMARVGVSGGGVTEAFWKAFEATGQPLYLAKALTLANTVMAPDDEYGKKWNTPACAGIDVLEFHVFLKKHGLPGAE